MKLRVFVIGGEAVAYCDFVALTLVGGVGVQASFDHSQQQAHRSVPVLTIKRLLPFVTRSISARLYFGCSCFSRLHSRTFLNL